MTRRPRRRTQSVVVWLLCVFVFEVVSPAFADETRGGETILTGANRISAPAALKQPEITDSFRCERRFLYKGKILGCDSNVQRDAERLRPIISDVPSAVTELDTYQRNRQNVRTAAYVGSIGLLVALGGLLLSRSFTDANGDLTNTGKQVRGYTLGGGLALTGISLIYGLSILTTNETHLQNAVTNFNQVHTDHPIELQFTTGFSL